MRLEIRENQVGLCLRHRPPEVTFGRCLLRRYGTPTAFLVLVATLWSCTGGDSGHEDAGAETGSIPGDLGGGRRGPETLPAETSGDRREIGAPSDSVRAGDTGPPSRLFSFAIITDQHIGEGFHDFGTPGYDDSGGEEHPASLRLLIAIQTVEAVAAELDIHFVLVLGDLTDSAEGSEFALSRQVLDELTLPWLPLIGNHDMWPYYRTDVDTFEEAPLPTGDAAFMETFQDRFILAADVFPSLELAAGPVYNPEMDMESRFINFSFEHMGTRFLCLDLVTRNHAPPEYPGIGPDSQLHDFQGGTWPWLLEQLDEHPPEQDQSVLVFAHHPLVALELESFSLEERGALLDTLFAGTRGQHVKAWFAGHWHTNVVGILPSGHPMVITAATKDSSTVRVVQVFSDGSIDYETILENEGSDSDD